MDTPLTWPHLLSSTFPTLPRLMILDEDHHHVTLPSILVWSNRAAEQIEERARQVLGASAPPG